MDVGVTYDDCKSLFSLHLNENSGLLLNITFFNMERTLILKNGSQRVD